MNGVIKRERVGDLNILLTEYWMNRILGARYVLFSVCLHILCFMESHRVDAQINAICCVIAVSVVQPTQNSIISILIERYDILCRG